MVRDDGRQITKLVLCERIAMAYIVALICLVLGVLALTGIVSQEMSNGTIVFTLFVHWAMIFVLFAKVAEKG